MTTAFDEPDAYDDGHIPLLGWHTLKDASPFDSHDLDDDFSDDVQRYSDSSPGDTDPNASQPPT